MGKVRLGSLENSVHGVARGHHTTANSESSYTSCALTTMCLGSLSWLPLPVRNWCHLGDSPIRGMARLCLGVWLAPLPVASHRVVCVFCPSFILCLDLCTEGDHLCLCRLPCLALMTVSLVFRSLWYSHTRFGCMPRSIPSCMQLFPGVAFNDVFSASGIYGLIASSFCSYHEQLFIAFCPRGPFRALFRVVQREQRFYSQAFAALTCIAVSSMILPLRVCYHGSGWFE